MLPSGNDIAIALGIYFSNQIWKKYFWRKLHKPSIKYFINEM